MTAAIMHRVTAPCGTAVGRSLNGVTRFLGLPYAQPPLGSRRWRAARPLPQWIGELDAVDPGPAPLQPIPVWGSSEAGFGGDPAEDCLRLSVWVPADAGGPLPVLVWLYGGGFESGWANAPITDPASLARGQHVVVVAPNYRVGALGFAQLAHRGGPFEEAGNLGLLDAVRSLAWVQDNIAAFGGEPDSVTVLGQSAGGFLAAALLGVPAAVGLFHQLMVMSGGASRIVPLATAQELGDRFLFEVSARLGTTELSALAAAGANLVLAAQGPVPGRDIGLRNGIRPHAFGVVADDQVLRRHPMSAVADGAARRIPIVVGATAREVAAFRPVDKPFAATGIDGLRDELVSWAVPPERAEVIVAAYLYRARSEASASLQLLPVQVDTARELLLTDWIYRLPAARLAQTQADAGGSAWSYSVESCPALGIAVHGIDVPLIFDTADAEMTTAVPTYPASTAAARHQLGSELRCAVGLFAHTGNPGWPAWTTDRTATQLFLDPPRTSDAACRDTLSLWQGIGRP